MSKAKPNAASRKPPKAKEPRIPPPTGGGRPSSFTPEIGLDICEAIANNMSLVSWCNGHSHEDRTLERKISAGDDKDGKAQALLEKRRTSRKRPAYRTVMVWIGEHEQFQVQYTLAGQHRADYQFEEMVELADNRGIPAEDRRLMIDTRKWTASRMNRNKYGDRVDLLTAPDTGNDDQKSAELAGLLAKAAGAFFVGESAKILEKLGVKISSKP